MAVGKIFQRIKRYADGTTATTGASYNHHCGECDKAADANCLTQKHLAYCEVPKCGNIFWTGGNGCTTHGYNNGYNLQVLADKTGISLEEVVNKVFINDQKRPRGYEHLPVEKKIDAIRTVFHHDMSKCEVEKEEEKIDKKSEKKAARTKQLEKKYSKYK